MADDLPEQFDLIVIGTGFTESCIASAASRIGKTVLHIDPNEHYGGAWASFNLEAFNSLLENPTNVELQNSNYRWHTSEITETSDDTNENDVWTQERLIENSRRFNIDLCPKILYANGELVKLLIKSNICRYAEFRAVDRVCTYYANEVITVPCSRSDVFNTKHLNIVEKRLLMKFLTTCMTYGEDTATEDMLEYRGKLFIEYLRAQRVTDKIATCVFQAIAMCNAETSFEEGMARTQKFLSSLGRYGNTPFLFPMYGCGEIPQCFCRLCAVFGGIYCLKRNIERMNLDDSGQEVHLQIDGKKVRTSHVVSSHGNLPEFLNEEQVHGLGEHLRPQLSRGIFIATSAIGSYEQNNCGGGVSVLRLTSGSEHEAILIQLSHYSGTCPQGIYLYHLTTPAVCTSAEADLAPFVGQVFNHPDSPKILYSAYFTLTARVHMPITPTKPETRIFCAAAPYYELDYDSSIKNARDIFELIYPTAEFLPRAPDPEEIVVDGEDPRALSEHNLPDDLREQLHALETNTERMDIEDQPDAVVPKQEMEAE